MMSARTLIRQLQLGERRSRGRLVQRNEVGRPCIVAAGRHDRGNHGAGQSGNDGRTGYRVMPRARLDQKEIGASLRRGEIALGLTGKKHFGRGDLMRACRDIGIGVGSYEHLPIGLPSTFTSQAQRAMDRPSRFC